MVMEDYVQNGHNDIALLKVARIKFSNKILPACLPTSGSDYTNKEGTYVLAAVISLILPVDHTQILWF